MQIDPSTLKTELPTLCGRYLSAQIAGDRREALRVVIDEGLGGGVGVPSLYLDVVQPAQREIGVLWQKNRISVAQEHLATAISQLALVHLYRQMQRARGNGKRVLMACVEGERHDMGARVGADFLEMQGFGVMFLGADVPTESLVSMIAKEKPDLVALSVTMSFHLDSLRRTVDRVRAVAPRTPIAVGGHAFTWAPELAGELPGEVAIGEDAPGLVKCARDLLKMDAA